MEATTPAKKSTFTSESSVIVHPVQQVKEKSSFSAPTWLLLLVLFIAFFVLKGFIYISDEKRHGK